MTIEEAWAAIENAAGRDLWDDHVKPAVRAALLTVHVEACREMTGGYTSTGNPDDPPDTWEARCGDGWYCEKAQEIQKLGQEGDG